MTIQEAEIRVAFDVLRAVVDNELEAGPMVLTEYGPRFEDKYLFVRLDFIRTAAGALGYDTTAMRDPEETRR